MNLPHNSYTTNLSLEDAVAAARNDQSVEVDLVASKHFWDFAGDWEKITSSYDSYFEETVNALAKILGKPIYQGRWNAPDREEWNFILPEFADAVNLAVWQNADAFLYFRYSWEDKEIPILMALGIKGCKPTGVAYPGQFD